MEKITNFVGDPRFRLIRQLNTQILKHSFDPSVSISIQHEIAKKILPKSAGRIIVPTVYGFPMTIDIEESHTPSMQGSIERNLYFLGTYEAGTLDVIRQSLTAWDNDTNFIEVGAHNGLMSIYAAQVGATNVFSFEPNPILFELLTANIKLNGHTNIAPLATALGDTQGSVSIELDEQNSGAAHITRVKDTTRQHTIPVDTLDNVAKTQALDQLNLLLIDVEGYENNVLIGAEKTISTYRPDLIIEYDPNNRDRRVTDFLHHYNYQIYILEHSRHLPGPLTPFKAARSTSQSDNYFCFQPNRAKKLGLA